MIDLQSTIVQLCVLALTWIQIYQVYMEPWLKCSFTFD